MKLWQWNKKGWPFLNDLELEDIARFRMPRSRWEFLIADPDYVASYLFTSDFCIVIPSWAGLRRYNRDFMKHLRKHIDQGNLVDDIGVLTNKATGEFHYLFGEETVTVPVMDFREQIRIIRKSIKASYRDPKLMSAKILSAWKKRLAKNSAEGIAPVGACTEFSQSPEVCRRIIENTETALELSGDRKFRVYTEKSRKLLKIDAGGYRIIVPCV